MISIEDAMQFESAKLSETEENSLYNVLRKAEEAVQDGFDRLGAILTVPADQGTSRVMVEACRKLSQPQTDGKSWVVTLHFNFVEGRPLLRTMTQNTTLLSYVLIISTDQISNDLLRVRRETATGGM